MLVAAVSDVSIGYGTPQLPLLTRSIMDHYSAPGAIVEPAQPECPPRHHLFPGIDVRRVNTMVHPHSEQGRQEYIWRASEVLDSLKPDTLIICCTYALPVLFRMRHRPRQVIYYSVELIPFYGPFDEEMNRMLEGRVDMVIFPEENRAVNEVRRYGFHGIRKVIVYNTSKRRAEIADPLPASARNHRILYSGALDPEATFARYYLSEKITTGIDLFGNLKMNEADRRSYMQILTGNVRYRGFISADELARVRPTYNQLFAAPNKFFDAIGDGVPPICAPHPQCKLLIERYDCGILLEDWSFEGFVDTLQRAAALAGSPEWERLAANCRRATECELNWDTQFEKVRKFLK
jgi:glycosyltransferase involved in cell wall biosynthesis